MSDAPRVLALDLSLTHTGVCENDGSTSSIVTGKLRGMERVDHIVRQVQSLACGVDLAVIESRSNGSKNSSSLLDLAGLNEVVRFLLYRLRVPYVDVPPGSLKKWATGNGNADKIAMVCAARERFGLTGTTDDNEADAYLLWALARHAIGDPLKSPTKYQEEALAKLDWPKPARRDAA